MGIEVYWIKLEKLKKVNIREIWNQEAYDFSDWLSTEENINELAEILGLSLVDVEIKVNVELF